MCRLLVGTRRQSIAPLGNGRFDGSSADSWTTVLWTLGASRVSCGTVLKVVSCPRLCLESGWAVGFELAKIGCHLSNKFLAHSCSEGALSATARKTEDAIFQGHRKEFTLIGAVIRYPHSRYGQGLRRQRASPVCAAHSTQYRQHYRNRRK
jgi:hypothetical protein